MILAITCDTIGVDCLCSLKPSPCDHLGSSAVCDPSTNACECEPGTVLENGQCIDPASK